MAGWIKIYKDLADHWLAQDLQKLGWWTILLLRVSHEDKKVLAGNTLIELKRGQIVASLSFLADLWKTSKRSAERFVELLEQDNMVRRCTSRKVTILTICNYASYQDKKEAKQADTCADDAPIGIQSVSEIKKKEEEKEINNNNSNAHTREEKVSWELGRENGFYSRFKAQGCGMTVARATGLKAADIIQLLDVFMAKCELNNIGHKDFDHFNSRFLWAIQNNKLTQPAKEQTKPQKKVITNEDLYREMYQ